MHDPKNQLDITLTEPVIFLRSSDPSGRLQPDPNDSPTLVRGILTLNVAKSIGISSIEVQLTGLLTVVVPEGVPPRHSDVHEKHEIYSSTVTVFRADQIPPGKRAASVGPGLSHAVSSNNNEHPTRTLSRPPSSLLSRRGSGHQNAVDVTREFGPTPPYTPTSIPHPPTPPVENILTLEELGLPLGDNPEGQVNRNTLCEQILPPSAPPHLYVSSLSDSTTNSDEAIASGNDSTAHSVPLSIVSDEDHPPHHAPLPSHPSDPYFPESTHGSSPCKHENSHDASNPHGHSRLRHSLSIVLDAIMEVTSRTPSRSRSAVRLEELERGRTRARMVVDQPSGESSQINESITGSGQLMTDASHPSAHVEHKEHHLLGIGRALGLYRDHEREKESHNKFKSKEQGECWREFKPGTYSYPISFLLPSNLPPTFSVPRGSLNYTIKSVAHRPGTFTPKLSCQIPLLVVAASTAGAGDSGGPGDPGPLFFQRQWEENLVYSIGMSSRLFLLGSQRQLEANGGIRANIESSVGSEPEARTEATYGTAILDLTLMPLEKIKIWNLSVFFDQHVRFLDGRRKLYRDEDNTQLKLLGIQDICPPEEVGQFDEQELKIKNKHKHKHEIPLLPTPISPHRSPLLRYISPSADPSILAGPGPYSLSISLGLPDCNGSRVSDGGLHFTVKHKTSPVRVEHSLRIVMRVERIGEESPDDHEGDKNRFFDITVQAPVTILSCRCVPEYQVLPEYSPTTEDGLLNTTVCPCQPVITGDEQGYDPVMSSSTRSSFESEDRIGHLHHLLVADEQLDFHERSRSSSQARRSRRPSPLATPLHPHSPLPEHEAGVRAQSHSHTRSYSQFYPVSTFNVRVQTPTSTPHSSQPSTPVARYERLVSGLESEVGEAPPSYESITSRF